MILSFLFIVEYNVVYLAGDVGLRANHVYISKPGSYDHWFDLENALVFFSQIL